jgi:type II secretory pathway pseudopilin PulG
MTPDAPMIPRRTRISEKGATGGAARAAFTLLELVVVLALVVAAAALAVGAFADRGSSQSLRRLAEDFRGLFGHIRLRAMEEGRVYQFAFQPNTGNYQILSPTSPVDQADAVAPASPPRFNGQFLFGVKQLEDGMIFLADENPPIADYAFVSQLAANGWRVSQFHPDGASDDVAFAVRTPDAHQIVLRLHGRTGRVVLDGPESVGASSSAAGGAR